VLQKAVMRELGRISRSTVMIYTDHFTSLVKEIDGGPWLNLDEIINVAESVDLKIKTKSYD
jgi:hypothetical protein